MTVEREIADVVGQVAGMTVKELPIGFALMRGDRVLMHIHCVLMPELDIPGCPLHVVQHLRMSAAAGLQARVVFAMPQGVMVKKITEGPIDGWVSLKGQWLQVEFGAWTVGGKTFDEERNPLTQIAASKKEWFE